MKLECAGCWRGGYDIMREFTRHTTKKDVYVCDVCGYEQEVMVLRKND